MLPHDNLALIAAAPRRVTIAGRDYPVSKLTPRHVGRLQALVMDKVPDPRKAVRELMEGLPSDVQIEMWRYACAEAKGWPPSLADARAQAALTSPDGFDLIVQLLIAPNVPGMGPAEAAYLVDAMTIEDFQEIIGIAAPGDPNAPKAGATAARPGVS